MPAAADVTLCMLWRSNVKSTDHLRSTVLAQSQVEQQCSNYDVAAMYITQMVLSVQRVKCECNETWQKLI